MRHRGRAGMEPAADRSCPRGQHWRQRRGGSAAGPRDARAAPGPAAGRLKLDLARYWELQAFAQFASDLDKVTQRQLGRGNRIVEILKQPQYSPMPVWQQTAIIYAATNGYLDSVPVAECSRFESEFLTFLSARRPEFENKVESTGEFSAETEELLKTALGEFVKSFVAEREQHGQR